VPLAAHRLRNTAIEPSRPDEKMGVLAKVKIKQLQKKEEIKHGIHLIKRLKLNNANLI